MQTRFITLICLFGLLLGLQSSITAQDDGRRTRTGSESGPPRSLAPWATIYPTAEAKSALAPPSADTSALSKSYLPLILSTTLPTSTPELSQTSVIRSDDFNASSLNIDLWSFIDPRGDATLRTNGTNVMIDLPAGKDHNVWTEGNQAPRLMQAAGDTDFEIEAKFATAPHGIHAMQGLIVQADDQNFLRFDFFSIDDELHIFAASFVDGAPTVRAHQIIAGGLPLYMRVRRVGDQWTSWYSFDKASWTVSADFGHHLAVGSVGFFVGNAGGSPPAYTGSIDYFFNTAAPIAPEDPNLALDTSPPVLSNLTYTTRASELELRWETDEPATTRVEYGTTANHELGASQDATPTYLHQVVVPGLQPNTTYQFRVVSADSTGHTGASGNQAIRTKAGAATAPVVDVWYGADQPFGQHGTPQRWVNILGRVSDPDGIASLRYALNGGPSAPLSIGPDTRRLWEPGDFNVEIDHHDLLNGDNTVTITATDTLGNPAVQAVHVHYTAGQTWPLPYSIDWSTATSIQQAAQVVDGLWTLEGDGVRTVEMGYDRLIDIGEVAWTDYEVTVPITIHRFNPAGFAPPSGGQAVGIALRWKGHEDWDSSQPRWGYNPKGAIGWYSWSGELGRYHLSLLGHGEHVLAEDTSGRELAFGVRYIFKMRVETQPGLTSMYRLKVWQDGTPEPSAWDVSGPGFPGELAEGSLLLVAHQTDATFGDVTVVPIAPSS
jgi:hypothetical protein